VVIAGSKGPDSAPKGDPAPVVKDKPAATEKLVVSGKVVDGAGKPVAGAKLYIPVLTRIPPLTEDDIGTKIVGESGTDGGYKVEFEKSEFTRYLIVGANGLAVGWANLERANGSHSADITLTKDQPIEGRVIDTEGKPVAGAAIKVMTVFEPGA